MNRILVCCKNMDLEETPFKCFYLGINWAVRYCQSCQRHFIQGMGLDINHQGTPNMIMLPVRYNLKDGCWIVETNDQKGYQYADN